MIGLVIVLVGARYLFAGEGPGEARMVPLTAKTISSVDEREVSIKVHIVGSVARPGLYDLDKGSRVADAIAVAGGPLPTAELSGINLAARLADGQQLVVPDVNDASPAGAAAGAAGTADGTVNLNSATLDELTELEGIGPKTAEKIIDYREENGGFEHIEELMDVPGIGPAKFEQVKDRIIV